MPTTLIVNVTTGESEAIEISETEFRRLRLGFPVSATQTEIDTAWAVLLVAQQNELSAEETLEQVRAAARVFLHSVNWVQELADIQAGLTAVANLRTATTLVQARDRTADILAGNGTTFPEGVIQKIEKLGRWMRAAAQLFAATDDMTTN